MTQVVTELIIDGRDATSGAAVYEQAMARVEAAHEKATAAQQRQATMLAAGTPQSVDRATAAFAKLQASIDPVSAASHRASLEMTRSLALVDRAVMLGVTTQIEADATISRLRDRQVTDIERVRQAQMRLVDTPVPGNDNRPGMGRQFNTGNIAAQFQDIGVTAAMGMNPLTIALQQGTQLSAVLQTMERPLEGIAAAFASIISPVSLATIAFVALLAVGLQFIDWPKLAAGALDMLGAALETIAPYAAIAAAGLALLYAPAIIGGVVSMIALLGRLAVAAVVAAGAMAAANPALALVAGFTIAIAAGNIFRDELTKILGVDIVAAAKTGANYVIGSFVAAYKDIKFVWNNFGNIIGAAITGAVNAVVEGANTMIQKAATGVDWLIDKLNQIPGVNLQKIGSVGDVVPKWQNDFAAKAAAAVDERNKDIAGDLNKDYLGEFGTAISKGASAASAKLKELADWIVKVDDKTKKKGARETDYDKEIRKIQERTEALRNEMSVIDLSTFERERLSAVTDLLNAAQKDGSDLGKRFADAQELINAKVADLTPELVKQRQRLLDVANGWAKVAAEAEEAKKVQEQMDFLKDLTRGFIDDLRSGLESGKGFWESFGNAALNVLDKITSKLLDEVLDALFKVNKAGSGSGGGFLGWLFSLFGGFTDTDHLVDAVMPWAKGGVFDSGNVIPFAKGGIVSQPTIFPMAKGAGLMGEAGPEAIMPLRRGPDGRLGVSAGGGSSGGAQAVRVSVGVSVDDDGKLQAYVRSVSQETTSDGIDGFTRTLPDHIEAYQADPRRRRA